MNKTYVRAIIMLAIVATSWFGVQKIEANTHHPDLVYDELSKSFYLEGNNSYSNQSLEEKYLTMKSINAYEEQRNIN